MAAINHPKELFLIPAYKELPPAAKLMIFEMAAFGGSGRVDAFICARGRDDRKVFDYLVNVGMVEVEDITFTLTCDFIKADNVNDRMKKSRLAKKDMQPTEDLTTSSSVSTTACPYEEIKNMFNEILGRDLGRVVKLTETRKAAVKARWNDLFRSYNQKTRDDGLKFFRWYFTAISNNEFYVRRTEKYRVGTHANWKADFDYVMKSKTFLKIYEDEYNANFNVKV